MELREVDSSANLDEKANELLEVIDRIIRNKDWDSITLLGNKPKNIIAIEDIINEAISPCQKLERIQEICSATHAGSDFEVFISKIKGRDDFTNELYDILADINPTEERSISNAIKRLNELEPPPVMTLS
ncbi:hypothetical protein [Legionella parisiensis]|uniref:Uncharacterized protein n=1 Tax=Legionella parisiensis TaxID=45071 RepID=A0A1E5JNI1_9GAMM|nr:hypothetical protein [Legionella parisiensis]KTD44340.1 hypothetical protein Lpar_0426 [Legionella parisiensis]OEH45903.1 hypothetical protein lpari_03091 [Legionella parisiensis]STX71966.1 Uncharacterised protein [Legionella parisiensis]